MADQEAAKKLPAPKTLGELIAKAMAKGKNPDEKGEPPIGGRRWAPPRF
jgi:hypothetical protein